MSSQHDVLKALEELCQDEEWVRCNDISEITGMSHRKVSRILRKLREYLECVNHRVVKDPRPVYEYKTTD